MRTATTSVVVLLALLSLAGVRADPFAGKWVINIEPDDAARKLGERAGQDMLVFKGNTLSCEWCSKRGFKPVEYEEDTRRFGPAKFEGVGKSKDAGQAKWTGTVTGGAISGDIVWTKPDGTELRYTYTGEIQH